MEFVKHEQQTHHSHFQRHHRLQYNRHKPMNCTQTVPLLYFFVCQMITGLSITQRDFLQHLFQAISEDCRFLQNPVRELCKSVGSVSYVVISIRKSVYSVELLHPKQFSFSHMQLWKICFIAVNLFVLNCPKCKLSPIRFSEFFCSDGTTFLKELQLKIALKGDTDRGPHYFTNVHPLGDFWPRR